MVAAQVMKATQDIKKKSVSDGLTHNQADKLFSTLTFHSRPMRCRFHSQCPAKERQMEESV